MVLLESLSLSLGTEMPGFTLKDPFGNPHSTRDLMGDHGLLVIFTCNHCPYAIAIWDRLIQAHPDFKNMGISMVAINPNINPDYPEDSPDAMTKKIKDDTISFPYLIDQTQEIARLYQAQCTPDLYLLKTDMSLFYHGRLDDNWQDESAVTRQDLFEAAKLLSSHKAPPHTQIPSMGCSIKWVT